MKSYFFIVVIASLFITGSTLVSQNLLTHDFDKDGIEDDLMVFLNDDEYSIFQYSLSISNNQVIESKPISYGLQSLRLNLRGDTVVVVTGFNRTFRVYSFLYDQAFNSFLLHTYEGEDLGENGGQIFYNLQTGKYEAHWNFYDYDHPDEGIWPLPVIQKNISIEPCFLLDFEDLTETLARIDEKLYLEISNLNKLSIDFTDTVRYPLECFIHNAYTFRPSFFYTDKSDGQLWFFVNFYAKTKDTKELWNVMDYNNDSIQRATAEKYIYENIDDYYKIAFFIPKEYLVDGYPQDTCTVGIYLSDGTGWYLEKVVYNELYFFQFVNDEIEHLAKAIIEERRK